MAACASRPPYASGYLGDYSDLRQSASDPELWADTMMSEELGYGSTVTNEYRAALATLVAFVVVGFLPLIVFVYDLAAPGEVSRAFAPTRSASRLSRSAR